MSDHDPNNGALEINAMDRILELRKKAEAELRDLDRKGAAIESKKEKVRFHISKLDEMMSDSEKALLNPKRPGDPTSLPVLMENALERHPEGLTVAQLLNELNAVGFESMAKNPIANLTSVLYRCRPTKFEKLKDGRWYLPRLGVPAPELRLIEPRDQQEMTMKHGARVPKEMR
jgi:hypothetical protein